MGKRTFLAMGVMVGCSLLVLVGFIVLYTKIAPQKASECVPTRDSRHFSLSSLIRIAD